MTTEKLRGERGEGTWLDTSAARQRWSSARRFEAKVRSALAPERVAFAEWLLLEALLEDGDPNHEGYYQVELARKTGLSERVVSYWMVQMAEDGLIDRGPGEDPRHWSVILARLGERTLRRCHERLEAAGLSR